MKQREIELGDAVRLDDGRNAVVHAIFLGDGRPFDYDVVLPNKRTIRVLATAVTLIREVTPEIDAVLDAAERWRNLHNQTGIGIGQMGYGDYLARAYDAYRKSLAPEVTADTIMCMDSAEIDAYIKEHHPDASYPGMLFTIWSCGSSIAAGKREHDVKREYAAIMKVRESR